MAKEKSRKELTEQDRFQMMEMYRSGDPALQQKACGQMLEALDEYIYYLIHKRFAGYIGMIDDLAQSGRLAILEHMVDYNPKYKLTTFFSFHIQNALQELVNRENGESHYYAESKNLIVKTMRALGMDKDNIDEQVLAMHLNMTQSRLHSILEKTLHKRKVELIEEDMETSTEYYDGPESAYMKNEIKKVYRHCIEQLDEDEQVVLCMHFGFYYPKYNERERTYKLTDIQQILNKDGMDINVVNVYRAARRHIADLLQKHGLAQRKNRYQRAREDVGFKFSDKDMANELFEALNNTELGV